MNPHVLKVTFPEHISDQREIDFSATLDAIVYVPTFQTLEELGSRVRLWNSTFLPSGGPTSSHSPSAATASTTESSSAATSSPSFQETFTVQEGPVMLVTDDSSPETPSETVEVEAYGSGVPVGVIAGAVSAFVALCGCILVLVLLRRQQRKRLRPTAHPIGKSEQDTIRR